jgi:hypothetical protein
MPSATPLTCSFRVARQLRSSTRHDLQSVNELFHRTDFTDATLAVISASRGTPRTSTDRGTDLVVRPQVHPTDFADAA